MKLTLLTPALVAILGLALAGAPISAQAQTPAPAAPTTPAAPAKPKKTSYEGSLTAIDTAGSSVTIESTTKKAGVKTLVLLVDASTKIKRDNKTATLADFKVGEKVTGSYTADAAGKLTAASLHFGATTKKKEKAPKTPATTPTTTAPAAPAGQ
jgi:hypothetical protein